MNILFKHSPSHFEFCFSFAFKLRDDAMTIDEGEGVNDAGSLDLALELIVSTFTPDNAPNYPF